MKNRIYPLFFALPLCLALEVAAQKHFIPARWTQPDGTQLDIRVDFHQGDALPDVIKYKQNEGAPERDLHPVQVRELLIWTRPEEIYTGRETEVAVISKTPSATSKIERQRKAIFLRALVIGRLNLYEYLDERGIEHYFLEKDTLWEELIHHDYYVDDTRKNTRTHYGFRTPLMRATADCPALAERTKAFAFRKEGLVDLVSAYNSPTCNGRLAYRYEKPKGAFHIGLRAGGAVNFNKTGFEAGSKYAGKNTRFQPKIGISALYFLPRRIGREALLVDLLYDQQAYETTTPVPTRITENFIQIHLSVRKYYTARGAIQPFLNGGLLFGLPVGQAKRSRGWTLDYSPSAQSGASLGAGARWKHLEVETRLMANHLLGLKRGGVHSSFTWMFTLMYRL